MCRQSDALLIICTKLGTSLLAYAHSFACRRLILDLVCHHDLGYRLARQCFTLEAAHACRLGVTRLVLSGTALLLMACAMQLVYQLYSKLSRLAQTLTQAPAVPTKMPMLACKDMHGTLLL